MGPPATVLVPVAEGERIATLDVVRGFALLGILLMNVEFFGRALADLDGGMAPGTTGIDRWIDWLVYVLVRGKFWTMFSLLFGMGFAVMLSRAEGRGAGFTIPYLRRTLALALIGAAHAILLWGGDILFGYAIGAGLLLLLLPWLRQGSPEKIGASGVALFVAPFLLLVAGTGSALLANGGGVPGSPERQAEVAAQAAAAEARVAAETRVMQAGSLTDAVAWRLAEFPRKAAGDAGFSVIVLGVFLIGAALLRSGAMRDPGAHLPLFRKAAWLGIPLGVGLGLVAAAIATHHARGENDARFLLATALATLGSLPASLGYIGVVVLAFHGRWRRWFGLLAPAGRMALSNYLLQSLAGVLVFHGYGLGLWGMGRAAQVLLALAVFALQVALSHWWLARFRYGPMEWLWRAATYWRLPPLRRGSLHLADGNSR